MAISSLCAVHCVGTTLLVSVAGISVGLLGERLELWFVGGSALVAILAIRHGYIRHRALVPVGVALAGGSLVLLARFVEVPVPFGETMLSVLGAGLLVAAHVANLHALRAGEACCE